MHPKRRDTVYMLNLKRSNQATLVQLNESYSGMLDEVKDYVTWGPLSRPMLVKMLSKRGFIGSKKLSTLKSAEEIDKFATELEAGKSLKDLGINRNFRLTPPSKGWKGKKLRYPQGDLGPRESMDSLLTRMI
jgi:ribosomal protein L30/L7E